MLAGLLLLLLVSGGVHILEWRRTRALEGKVWLAKRRLAAFAALTSGLLNENCRLTREQIAASRFIGYPYRAGDDYILDLDPHYGNGIKYVFDGNDRLTRWEEYPKIRILMDDGSGRMVDRPVLDVIGDADSE